MDSKPPPAALTDARRFTRKDTLLLGFLRYKRINGRVRVRPVWRRCLAGLVVLAAAGWLAAAAGIWFFVTHTRGVKDVSYFEIALPNRWNEYRRKRGESYIELARAAQERGEYREAYQLFRAGLSKAPANLDGRRRLASLLVLFGRPDLAIETFDAGLSFAGDDFDYLSNYVQLLLVNHEDARILELVEQKAAAFSAGSQHARLLGIAGATASFFRGDFAQAEAFLRRFDLVSTNEGRLLGARMEWERGLGNLALIQLRQLVEQSPGFEEAHAVLVLWLHALGNHKAAESAAVLRSVTFPDSVPAQLALLGAFRDAGSLERLSRQVDLILARAPGQPALAAGAAEFAINTADIGLADRIHQLAVDGVIPPQVGALVSIEARLAGRDWTGALERIDALQATKPDWLEHQAATLAGLHAVALLGSGQEETGQLQLNVFLAQPGIRAESLVAIARRLKQAGAVDSARRVLTQIGSSKLNQSVLMSLVELDIETGDYSRLIPNLEKLLGMRRPPSEFLRRAAEALGSDRFLFDPHRDELFARIDELLRGRASAGVQEAAGSTAAAGG